MKNIRNMLQHILNPLHVYCRLAPLVGRECAKKVSLRWEYIYTLILG